MLRNIVKIDGNKCTGCGKCAEACVEGAIKIIDGKAVLISEAYCDGLGACLPACPVDAISIEKKDVEAFVNPSKTKTPSIPMAGIPMTSCPGSEARRIQRTSIKKNADNTTSCLEQWPVQLRLVPASAPFFDNCDLLIAADCSAFAYGGFHERFLKGKVLLIGCPKLDPSESWNKIKDILTTHEINSITLLRMDVPCCSPLVNKTLDTLSEIGKALPVRIFTIFSDGTVTESS